jgi:hypothetical protein
MKGRKGKKKENKYERKRKKDRKIKQNRRIAATSGQGRTDQLTTPIPLKGPP